MHREDAPLWQIEQKRVELTLTVGKCETVQLLSRRNGEIFSEEEMGKTDGRDIYFVVCSTVVSN